MNSVKPAALLKTASYRAFLLHLQDVADVVLLGRAAGAQPLQSHPGDADHLQLGREGRRRRAARGEQLHRFTELAAKMKEREGDGTVEHESFSSK